ncbi:Protein kinase family protein [Euphorbia peplus]|nr:Protein kinase family protein [Euphorbia peplus]
MHRLAVPSPALAAFLITVITIFLLSLDVPAAVASQDTFPYCNRTFSCGPLTNVHYPFSGGLRPDYCGLPGFQLTCVDNTTTLININSLVYRVIQLNQLTQTLLLSREDLFNTTCTNLLIDTTFNNTLFAFGANSEILTLFYGCNESLLPETSKPENMFTCEMDGRKDAYYLIGSFSVSSPKDPILSVFKCSASIQVPVLFDLVDDLEKNRSLLSDVLKAGFNASYRNPFSEDCVKCYHSGGQCGFDLSLGRSLCICDDDRSCPREKSKSIGLAVGLGIAAAAIVGSGLVCWFLLIVQKRKRVAARKDVQTPATPFIKGQAVPISNFSRTTPSYTSSKSDIEKGSTYFGTQVFSYEELVEATDNFDPSKVLGDGGFGTVYYGILNDGRVVAVKRLYDNNIKRAEQFMNEIEILTRLRHKNLVTLYGCTSRHSQELLLVYEYISNGTVADHLHGKKTNSSLLTWRVRLSIAIETADALVYLHSSDVIHRDVKTTNILLDNNFRVKVADFGLSRLLPTDVTHVSTAPQGTPGYVDPEYYQCYQLTDKSDVYSFGVVLVELLSSLQAVDTSRHRLDINLANMAVTKIQNHLLNELVDPLLGFENNDAVRQMTTSVAELAFRCLQQERDIRPTMTEVLEGLKKIEHEHYGSEKLEAADVKKDDVGLLDGTPSFSPDSGHTDKWGKIVRSM